MNAHLHTHTYVHVHTHAYTHTYTHINITNITKNLKLNQTDITLAVCQNESTKNHHTKEKKLPFEIKDRIEKVTTLILQKSNAVLLQFCLDYTFTHGF